MEIKRPLLLLFITLSFSIWLICPWNNSSVAARSFNLSHAAHGHSSSHEEESHHASKGDHSCITPISYSKEDSSSKIKISTIHLEALKIDAFNYHVKSVSIQLFDTHLPKRFIRLYQLHSVYLL